MSRRFRIILAIVVGVGVGYGLNLFRVFGQPRAVLRIGDDVLSEFSPDGGLLVTTPYPSVPRRKEDYAARFWDTRTGIMLQSLGKGSQRPIQVAFSPDGVHWAFMDWDGSIELWRWREGILLASLENVNGKLSSRILFSEAGDLLIAGLKDLRNAKSGSQLIRFDGVSDAVDDGPSPAIREEVLLEFGRQETRTIHLLSGKTVGRFPGFTGYPEWYDLSADGKVLLVSKRRDLDDFEYCVSENPQWKSFGPNPFANLTLSPDGVWFFVAETWNDEDSRLPFFRWLFGKPPTERLRLFHLESGTESPGIEGASHVRFAPDGKSIATLMSDGTRHIYDFPLRTPWPRIVIWAALAAAVVYRLAGLSFRKRKAPVTIPQG